MKVQELLENIKNENFNLAEVLQVKKYLPLEVKKTIAQGVIYECTNNELGAIKVDSIQKHMAHIRYMIETHTSLEYEDSDYDVLCSTECNGSNLLNCIIGYFYDDAKECERILNLMMDDYIQETKIDFTIAQFLHELTNSIRHIAESVNGKINEFDLKSIIPEDLDVGQLSSFINKYIK